MSLFIFFIFQTSWLLSFKKRFRRPNTVCFVLRQRPKFLKLFSPSQHSWVLRDENCNKIKQPEFSPYGSLMQIHSLFKILWLRISLRKRDWESWTENKNGSDRLTLYLMKSEEVSSPSTLLKFDKEIERDVHEREQWRQRKCLMRIMMVEANTWLTHKRHD